MPRATLSRTADAEGDRRKLVELIIKEEAAVVVVVLPSPWTVPAVVPPVGRRMRPTPSVPRWRGTTSTSSS